MKELDRRSLLKYAPAGVGLGLAVMAGFDVKRFLSGDAERESQAKEELQHTLDTRQSIPTLTGWRINYPKQEAGVRYVRTEGQFADFGVNSEVTLSNFHTAIYLSDYTRANGQHSVQFNLQQKTPEWYLPQPGDLPLKDEKANVSAIQFAHPDHGFVFLSIWQQRHEDNGNPVFRVQRMDKYRGY